MQRHFSTHLQSMLGTTLVVYLCVMYAIGWIAQRRIRNTEDFLVAGRRLPLSLAWLTILATWFGAGTLLAVADEVRVEGLRAAGLDPLGAGCCLIIAGLFVAGPMWRHKLLTVPDFFGKKYGPTAELISALILVPSYFGWIAAQFVALAGILELFFGIDPAVGLPVVASLGMGYTLMGGMWSVTLTDAVQIILVMVGLIVLVVAVTIRLGDGNAVAGMKHLVAETPPEKLRLIPIENLAVFWGWLGIFLTGALGNLPVQDLMQRVFASRSDVVARRACLIAGTAYLLFGTLPLVLALAANVLLPESTREAILPALAQEFLSPTLAIIFLLALLSAILSTIDSALLAPASVLAQNVFPRWVSVDALRLNRGAVVLVTGLSLVVAYSGENAYSLLEESYSFTLVGLFVPLLIGLYSTPRGPRAGLAAMLLGTGTWALHFVFGWDTFLSPIPAIGKLYLPVSLSAVTISLAGYLFAEPPWRTRWHRCEPVRPTEAIP